jgi:ribosomal-protein-alanine N-acetyltransferase
MPKIKLVEMTNSLGEASTEPEQFRRACGAEIDPRDLQHFREMAKQSHDFYASVAAHAPWVGYVVIDAVSNQAIGCCGFKGNPDEKNEVEISYHTWESYEGRGFATAMAHQMFRLAENAEPGVKSVIAHTLAEENASTSILKKCQFRFAGQVQDPEDGPVWRWEKKTRRSN